MASRVDWYLVELDRQLQDFPEERRLILVAEVEGHFREQVDEMVAAGMNLAEADAEAVRVFGEPKQFVERLRQEDVAARSGMKDELSLAGTKRAMIGMIGGPVMLAVGTVFIDPGRHHLYQIATLIALLVVMAGAFSSRRISLASIGAGVLCGVVLTALVLAAGLVDLGPLDGRNTVSIRTARYLAANPQVLTGDPIPLYEGSNPVQELKQAMAVPFLRKVPGFLGGAFTVSITGGLVTLMVWLGRMIRRVPAVARSLRRWRTN